jgi:hypothetical protein
LSNLKRSCLGIGRAFAATGGGNRGGGEGARKSKRTRALIRQLSTENLLWGAPRIHGELLKLGFSVAQSTVAKYMVKRGGPPSQGWKTFLRNHAPDIAAMDLFVVPFPWDEAPGYMIRDRDRIYGTIVTRRLRAISIRDKPITPASPWQNGFVERLIGSIRRECVDHIIVLGEAHLRRILTSYARYYNETRTHLALDKDTPVSRPGQRTGAVRSLAILGGLHHRYARA